VKKAKNFSRWIGLACLVMASTTLGQGPHFVNAKMQNLSARTGLEQQFRAISSRQVEAAWVGYAVPVIPGNRSMCCYESSSNLSSGSNCGRCELEGHQEGARAQSNDSKSVKLESPELLVALFRLIDRNVQKIRVFSPDCELDAGGLPVYWLTDVRPNESVALLSSFVMVKPVQSEEEQSRHMRNSAVAAIALHADTSADRALDQFVAPGQPEALRKNAVFWLGSARGKRGYEVLQRIVREDPSDKVREHAVFALSISKEPQAVDTMIEVAHKDFSSHVRGQALFWLAQKAGQKAVGAITEAIEKDPETEVKRHAVFALSQLPGEEGVPKLIEVARSNRNPAVRKQAIFWLGQSKDPRALEFFEQILLH